MLEAPTSIPWTSDLEAAFDKAKTDKKLVLLEFSQAPRCAGSVALREQVYPHLQVSDLIVAEFVPVSLLRSERLDDARRFNVVWTPTVIIAEPDGTERHRIVGFLPRVEFMAQLELGVSKAIFGREQFVDAQHALARVAQRYRETYAGPEASYWFGVSEYKQGKNRDFLRSTALRLREEYPDTEWAVKASVWVERNGTDLQ